MVKQLLASTLVLVVALTACGSDTVGTSTSEGAPLTVGTGGGYLSATLYAADEALAAQGTPIDLQEFRSHADVGYALLSNTVDVGFVEAEKLAALAALDGFEQLTVAGKVTYPYGATVVVRKDLDVRLQELDGLVIAASAPTCKLLDRFAEDAERLGASLDHVTYEYLTFDAMLPALEAGVIDAAVIKGSYMSLALHEGHTVLYQSWDVEPGDECCPAIIDQAELVLLVQRDREDAAQPLLEALDATQKLSPDELRQAVVTSTTLSFDTLQGQPVPEFSRADDELVALFVEAAEDHDD
ncbi:MAG: hypothetical protein FWG78_01790 [Coriobacteriia bacterium]|nr:hypothetical protein [Coriobacteriia bacterium]